MSIFKRSAPGFSLVACATLMLPGFTGTANAAPGALIRNYQSGKCLDADANFLRYNGDRVRFWTCNGGANQKWLPIPGNPNVKNQVVLENAADGKCLDADANGLNNNGDRIQLRDRRVAGAPSGADLGDVQRLRVDDRLGLQEPGRREGPGRRRQ